MEVPIFSQIKLPIALESGVSQNNSNPYADYQGQQMQYQPQVKQQHVIRKIPWPPEDDNLLLDAYQQHHMSSTRYALIAKHYFTNATRKNIRNRLRYLEDIAAQTDPSFPNKSVDHQIQYLRDISKTVSRRRPSTHPRPVKPSLQEQVDQLQHENEKLLVHKERIETKIEQQQHELQELQEQLYSQKKLVLQELQNKRKNMSSSVLTNSNSNDDTGNNGDLTPSNNNQIQNSPPLMSPLLSMLEKRADDELEQPVKNITCTILE